jgi:hypothetical protein
MKWVAGGMLTALAIATESGGGLSSQALGSGEGVFGLGDFSGQGARGLRKAGAFQLHRLQLYEIINVCLHPSL